MQRFRNTIGWFAVTCSTLLACFWAFWGIIENFHEGWWASSLGQNLAMMLGQYLSPMMVIMGVTAISIRWPRAGGSLHLAAAAFAWWFFRGGPGHYLIALPLALLGASYWVGRPEPRKWAYVVLVSLPFITLIVCGAEPVWRVFRRFDDGVREARLIQGNGVELIWAPAGPGWPTSGVPWQEAQRRARFLREDGRSLAETPQEIWRLPTAKEAVASLCRHGRHAGGIYDSTTGKVRYDIIPDKESPLWDTHSQVIYWWTATEVDSNRALRVSFNGFVNPLPKHFAPGYLGFRAVREPRLSEKNGPLPE